MSTQVSGGPAQLVWLRSLLDDVGNPEVEEQNALPGQTEFFIAAPPISTVTVIVNGIVIDPTDPGTGYTIPATADEIVFNNPVATDDLVQIRYTRQTWGDAELNGYIAEAQTEYVRDRHVVYRAAIFAVDTLISGAATAFNFGSGQENFDYNSVFDRLRALRDDWGKWLEANAEEGILEIARVRFPSLEPGDIRDDPAGQPYTGQAGIFPASSGGYGGLDP